MKKSCKKEISLLLVLSMLLTMLPVQALAAAYPEAGEGAVTGSAEGGVTPYATGDVTYTIKADTTITVDANGVLTKCIPDTATEIEIPAEIPEDAENPAAGTRDVTGIGDSAFAYCSGLTSVTIPDSVTSIGERAFFGCSNLKSITIPASVAAIGAGAFACSTANISVDEENPNYCFDDNILFSKDKTALISCPAGEGRAGAYTVPESVTSIEDSAFHGCSNLTSVTIPDGVTSIGNDAFCGCSRLTSITIPNSVTSIGGGAFWGCSKLIRVSIPNSVTSIGDSAFYGCSNLTSVTIPNGVTSIGAHAFSCCSRLTSVAIPNGVTSIEYSAFYNCSSLTNITIPDSVTSIEGHAFSGCSRLTNITIPDNVASIGDSAFYSCSSMTSVTIPDSVTSIEDHTFTNCSSLTSVTIPDCVTSIGSNAFNGCSGLTSITIGNSVTSIGDYAFNSCSGLTSIDIPDSVTSIGNDAFSYCSGLTSITIPNNVTSIGDYAFFHCSGLTSITIGNSVTSIGDDTFNNCRSLTSITIPDSVTSIGESAFYRCSSLTSVTIPDSVTSIEVFAFIGVSPDFVLYCYPGSYTETYAKNNNIKYELLVRPVRTLSISVLDEDGTALSEGFTVTWYDESGNKAGVGLKLSGADPGKSYSFTVTLGDRLAAVYEQPEPQIIAPADGAECSVQLEKKAVVKTLTLTGRVEDQNDAPIQGAAVSVTPADGELVEAVTGTDGGFSAVVPCGVLSVTIQKDGYYSKRETLDLTDKTGGAHDAGTYTLTPVQIITDRVTLNVTQRRAAEGSDTAMETPLSSLGAMAVSVAGKTNADFDVQGLTLVFKPGKAQAGEKITVTVTDPSGAYCAASTTVELDSNRLGSAELTMVQKGSLVLGGLSGPSANLLLFDSSGNCILTCAAGPGLSSGALEAGIYRLVLLQKSELLRGVSKLDYLGTFGLKAGSDYLLEKVSIADGQITRLPDCAVPALDEGRISYTLAENTSVTTNKPSGVVAGQLLMIRAAYELDPAKGVSADTLRIALPEGVALWESSVLVDNQTAPYTYDENSREVTVNMSGHDKAVALLYCTPVESGSYSVNAYLTLSNGASQPIGAAVVRAEDAKLEVPERAGKAAGLTASGKAVPGAAVTLYDNDVKVRNTTANAAGSWSMSFDLVPPVYSYSYHNIYAVVQGGYLKESITTESVLVTYDKRLDVELTKITMYNTGDHGAQETVFDFTTNGSAAPYYRMWPSRYPTFTFKAEFAGDSSTLENVYVVTTNSAGDKTYVKMTYDEANKAWVGTHNYTSFSAAPVAVTAAYSYGDTGKIPEDEEMLSATTGMFMDASKEVMDILDTELYATYSCTEPTIDGNSLSAKLTYTDPETAVTEAFGTYSLEAALLEDEVTESTLSNEGFIFMDEAQLWSGTEYGDASITRVYVDLNARICLTEKATFEAGQSKFTRSSDVANYSFLGGIFDDWGPGEWHYWLVKLLEFIPGYGLAASLTEGIAKTYEAQNVWRTRLNGNVFTLQTDIDTVLYGILEARCKGTGMRKVPDSVYSSARMSLLMMPSEVAEYERKAREMINDSLSVSLIWFLLSAARENCSSDLSKVINSGTLGKGSEALVMVSNMLNVLSIASTTGEIAKDVLCELLAVKNSVDIYIDGTYNNIENRLDNIRNAIKASYISCNDPSKEPDITTSDATVIQSSNRHVQPIADPSGYVYEAVPSNRIEGVTATISSKEENGAAWNAANYDQVNPQVTGTDGGYYWDVPQGSWKVSFTKAGYTPTNTEAVAKAAGYADGWLPVPPPQLEINVGMVSTAAPAVQQAAAYTDRAEVAFSQYMNIESVKAALSLTQDGAALSGCTVKPLNAEYDLEETAQYATRFAIAPSGGDLSGSITVTVGETARNYAGTPMAGAYTSPAMAVSARPTGIAAPDTVSVVLREATGIPVTLQPGVAGQKLTVESLSPALVTVSSAEVTTGADGSAEITLTGILPGSGLVRVSDPASGLSKTVTVNVGAVKDVPPVVSVEPVTAALEDGTIVTSGMAVPQGAKIRLQTETPGAVIRYTLNDTCPCKEEALTYNTPITITGDTVLRAAAYKDGIYSETVRLELNIQPSGGSDSRPSGGGGGGTASGKNYSISIPSVVTGGAVRVSPGSAGKGAVVTITVTPDSGCKLEKLTVTDSKNNVLKLTGQGDGKYTFIMPADSVKVEASFVVSGTPWVNPFTDVAERAWYYDAVRFVNENGLMDGYDNGLFGADDDLSRAQLAQILYNREGKPSASAGDRFADVADEAWYAGAVAWAFTNGVAGGYGDGRFGPNDSITREQLAVMLWRYTGSPTAANKELNFSDADTASVYALEALRWAVENGIINGYGDGRLGPKGLATRAQAAQILKNYLER